MTKFLRYQECSSTDLGRKHLHMSGTALDNITQWTRCWRIKLNEAKSVHVTCTLRRKDLRRTIQLNGRPVPQAETAKYLGLYLDSRLNWKLHVKQKTLQIKEKLRQIYWIIGRRAKTSLKYKVLIYKAIIKPISTYGIQLWGCTKPSNRLIIQQRQNIILRPIVDAYRYTPNEMIHDDLGLEWVD
jgi:hypothetical protein